MLLLLEFIELRLRVLSRWVLDLAMKGGTTKLV